MGIIILLLVLLVSLEMVNVTKQLEITHLLVVVFVIPHY